MDTNVWCRPFDDLQKKKIFKEAEAVEKILLMAVVSFLKIITSEVVMAEVLLIEEIEKREEVEFLITTTSAGIIQADDQVIRLAERVQSTHRLKDFVDALHIAVSIQTNSLFITCDNELLKLQNKNLKIRDPIEFLKEMEV